MYAPTNGNYDAQMTSDMRITPNAVVGWLLMASYVYYVEHARVSLLSDQQFDKACNWLLRHYDGVTHKYKHLLPREALVAGTAYHLREKDYPRGLVQCAVRARMKLEAV